MADPERPGRDDDHVREHEASRRSSSVAGAQRCGEQQIRNRFCAASCGSSVRVCLVLDRLQPPRRCTTSAIVQASAQASPPIQSSAPASPGPRSAGHRDLGAARPASRAHVARGATPSTPAGSPARDRRRQRTARNGVDAAGSPAARRRRRRAGDARRTAPRTPRRRPPTARRRPPAATEHAEARREQRDERDGGDAAERADWSRRGARPRCAGSSSSSDAASRRRATRATGAARRARAIGIALAGRAGPASGRPGLSRCAAMRHPASFQPSRGAQRPARPAIGRVSPTPLGPIPGPARHDRRRVTGLVVSVPPATRRGWAEPEARIEAFLRERAGVGRPAPRAAGTGARCGTGPRRRARRRARALSAASSTASGSSAGAGRPALDRRARSGARTGRRARRPLGTRRAPRRSSGSSRPGSASARARRSTGGRRARCRPSACSRRRSTSATRGAAGGARRGRAG